MRQVPENFGPYAQQAVSHLMNAMNRDDARVDDFMSATDNAVSALGKVFEVHGNLMDTKLLVSTWLQFLPLEHDTAEAIVAHEQLVRMVEKMDMAVLGDSNQNAGHLVWFSTLSFGGQAFRMQPSYLSKFWLYESLCFYVLTFFL